MRFAHEGGEAESGGYQRRGARQKGGANSQEGTMARKKDSLRYEPLYKPKPTDRHPQEEGRAGSGGWAALVWRFTFGRMRRRRRARITDKLLK